MTEYWEIDSNTLFMIPSEEVLWPSSFETYCTSTQDIIAIFIFLLKATIDKLSVLKERFSSWLEGSSAIKTI